MATTYELLGVATADDSGPTTLTVGSIPQTHDDLEIIAILMDNSTNEGNEVKFRCNGNTSGDYNFGKYRNWNNSVNATATLSGDNGLAVSRGNGPGNTGANYHASMTKIYIAGYTEASGGTPEHGYTSGLLDSHSFYNSTTLELTTQAFSMLNANQDPVTQFSATSTAFIENSILAVYGINRS